MTSHSIISELYISKEKRNARARELRKQNYLVRKGTLKNQRLHPMYIADFEGPEKNDTGPGNTVYRTLFFRLHKLEARYIQK